MLSLSIIFFRFFFFFLQSLDLTNSCLCESLFFYGLLISRDMSLNFQNWWPSNLFLPERLKRKNRGNSHRGQTRGGGMSSTQGNI